MIAGACAVGAIELGGLLADPGETVDPFGSAPIRLSVNGMDMRDSFLSDSLEISETLGQPTTCRFRLHDPDAELERGEPVLVRFHDYVLFAGSIDRVLYESPDLKRRIYACECIDRSFALMRIRLRRNFTRATIQAMLTSLLEFELSGESLSIGRVDSVAEIPLVDARNATIYDVLRDVATMTGQTLTVDADGRIHFLSYSIPPAPRRLTESVVMVTGTSLDAGREEYRNVQTVIARGTSEDGGEPEEVSVTFEQESQIAERMEREGGTGRYESVEEITHPLTNDPAELRRYANSVAYGLLSVGGTMRRTLHVVVYGYGFHAGQLASVELPTYGIVGDYYIERVRGRDQYGTGTIRYDLDLVESSLQAQAWQRWLQVVRQGKVIVQPPYVVDPDTSGAQTFDVPGTYNFQVPDGITLVTIESKGGSGGGGGGALVRYSSINYVARGGRGGNSGHTLSTVAVVPGETLTVVVGAKGVGGTSRQEIGIPYAEGHNGTSGTDSYVLRGTTVLNRAAGGARGMKGIVSYSTTTRTATITHGSNGAHGGGSDGVVTVGGGQTGGRAGNGLPLVHGGNGEDGVVAIRW